MCASWDTGRQYLGGPQMCCGRCPGVGGMPVCRAHLAAWPFDCLRGLNLKNRITSCYYTVVVNNIMLNCKCVDSRLKYYLEKELFSFPCFGKKTK